MYKRRLRKDGSTISRVQVDGDFADLEYRFVEVPFEPDPADYRISCRYHGPVEQRETVRGA